MKRTVRSTVALLFAGILTATHASAQSESDNAVAIIGPTSGTAGIIGEQMAGALSAQIIDSACNAEQGLAATKQVIAEGAKIIVGLPCIEALDSAAQYVFENHPGIALLAIGIQAEDITNRKNRPNWPVFRMGARQSEEAETIASHIKANWRDKNFAMIDDGTLYGRQLTETVRFLLEEDNLEPVFTDNYRPLLERQTGLVRRIQKSGATHVFIGGDAYDAAIIAKNAAALNINFQIAGGSALMAPAEDGILPDGTKFAAPEPVKIALEGEELTDYSALTFIAKEIAETAVIIALESGIDTTTALRTRSFTTALGDIRFDNDGENDRKWTTIYTVQAGEFIPERIGN